MRVLLKEYGSYSNLPLSITSNILEIEEYNMTESVRAKNKLLNHLPIASEFKFVELDLSNLVSYKTYECFEKQIRSRENLRKRRRAQEKKYNDKAKMIEEQKYEYYLRTNLEVNTKRKSRLVPEWATAEVQNDETWFTLDGKEIKKSPKGNKSAWQGEDLEIKEEEKEEEPEVDKENSDENLWNDFEIKPQGPAADDFPVLGGGSFKQEKIPVIVSKVSKGKNQPKKNTKKKLKYTNDDGVKKEVQLNDDESQFLASNDGFTLDQFMVVDSRGSKKGRKRKGRR